MIGWVVRRRDRAGNRRPSASGRLPAFTRGYLLGAQIEPEFCNVADSAVRRAGVFFK